MTQLGVIASAFPPRSSGSNGGDEFVERIADAEAPFGAHVRDALAERHA